MLQQQQQWLMFLRHVAKCTLPEAECPCRERCTQGKALWAHIMHCSDPHCTVPRCTFCRELLQHHQRCQVGMVWPWCAL